MKINILQRKIKGCTDSFFYEGEIATVVKPNGTRLTLIAGGDVRITITERGKEYYYRDMQRFDAIRYHKLDDKKLRRLEREGRLEWNNNNWFEVVWVKKGSDIGESGMGDVAHDYDAGISLLKSYYEDARY
jgi:hypothetical protein